MIAMKKKGNQNPPNPTNSKVKTDKQIGLEIKQFILFSQAVHYMSLLSTVIVDGIAFTLRVC